MKTGYFARATENGHNAKSTNVHILNNKGNTLCRYKPHKTMQFQWCSHGIRLNYVTCKTCKKLGNKLITENLMYRLTDLYKKGEII